MIAIAVVAHFGGGDGFMVVALLIAIAIGVVQRLRAKARGVQRADSALHGDANWLPARQAARLFGQGGIIIDQAKDGSSLYRFDGKANSGHMLVVAGSGGYKTSATVIPACLEFILAGIVASHPSSLLAPRRLIISFCCRNALVDCCLRIL